MACVLLVALAAAAPAAWASTNANWGTGVEAALPDNAGPDPEVSLLSVSCTSPGDCTALGNYIDSTGNRQGLLLTQTSGVWGTGVDPVPPTNAGPKLFLESLSCPSAGNCTAVGFYKDSAGSYEGLLLSETEGTWGTGVEATLPANAAPDPEAGLEELSCPSASNCTAIGSYIDSSGIQQGLLLTETAGVWGTGVEAAIPANAASDPEILPEDLSCSSPGNCTAVGNYTTSAGDFEGFLLTETSGTWGTGVEATGPANAEGSRLFLHGVSCPSVGNCSGVGDYFDRSGNNQGLLLSETAGVWGTGVEATIPANGDSKPNVDVFIEGVQCPSAGNCTAVGHYLANSDQTEDVLLTETSGVGAPASRRRCRPTPARNRTSTAARCRAPRRATAASPAIIPTARATSRVCS